MMTETLTKNGVIAPTREMALKRVMESPLHKELRALGATIRTEKIDRIPGESGEG